MTSRSRRSPPASPEFSALKRSANGHGKRLRTTGLVKEMTQRTLKVDGPYLGTLKYDAHADNVKANGGDTLHRLWEPNSEKFDIAVPSNKSKKVQPSIKQN